MQRPVIGDGTHRRRRLVPLLGLSILVLAAGVFLTGRSASQPVYQGRKIDYWFTELSRAASGTNEARRIAAHQAFAHMGREALPFLLLKLRHESGDKEWERTHWALRSSPALAPFARLIKPPSERLVTAAICLREIGTNALPALRPLLDIYRRPKDMVVIDFFVIGAIREITQYPECQNCNAAERAENTKELLARAEAICASNVIANAEGTQQVHSGHQY